MDDGGDTRRRYCFLFYVLPNYKRLYSFTKYFSRHYIAKELGHDSRHVLYAQNKQTDIIYNAIREFNVVRYRDVAAIKVPV